MFLDTFSIWESYISYFWVCSAILFFKFYSTDVRVICVYLSGSKCLSKRSGLNLLEPTNIPKEPDYLLVSSGEAGDINFSFNLSSLKLDYLIFLSLIFCSVILLLVFYFSMILESSSSNCSMELSVSILLLDSPSLILWSPLIFFKLIVLL